MNSGLIIFIWTSCGPSQNRMHFQLDTCDVDAKERKFAYCVMDSPSQKNNNTFQMNLLHIKSAAEIKTGSLDGNRKNQLHCVIWNRLIAVYVNKIIYYCLNVQIVLWQTRQKGINFIRKLSIFKQELHYIQKYCTAFTE